MAWAAVALCWLLIGFCILSPLILPDDPSRPVAATLPDLDAIWRPVDYGIRFQTKCCDEAQVDLIYGGLSAYPPSPALPRLPGWPDARVCRKDLLSQHGVRFNTASMISKFQMMIDLGLAGSLPFLQLLEDMKCGSERVAGVYLVVARWELMQSHWMEALMYVRRGKAMMTSFGAVPSADIAVRQALVRYEIMAEGGMAMRGLGR